MLTLRSVLVSSEDPVQLTEFYQELFQAEPQWKSDDSEFVGWKLGDSFFTVGPHDQIKGKNSNPPRIMLGFESNDVAAEFERAIKIEGATAVQAPYQPSEADEMWLSTLSDPDGNYFQIVSPFKM